MPFITYRFSDGISLVQEAGVANFMRCNIWLVRGRDRDLVIDTGMGLESLKDWISGETDRPLTAVATHAHFDHIAGFTNSTSAWVTVRKQAFMPHRHRPQRSMPARGSRSRLSIRPPIQPLIR